MRIIFSSPPGLGHIQPMLPLALQIQVRGHHVLWATGPDGCGRVASVGLATSTAGLTAEEPPREYRRRWPEALSLPGEARADHIFSKLFGGIIAHAAFPALLAAARQYKPDVMVSGAGDFAAPIVAASLGVPQLTHGFGAVIPSERVKAAGAEAADLWQSVGLAPLPFGGCYQSMYLDIYPPSLGEAALEHIPRIQRVRPGSLTALPGDSVPGDVARLLKEKRPVVYLTFGTVFNNKNPAFTAAVTALAHIPDVNTVITVGPTGDPGSFGALPAHIAIARYVPQSALLPRCSVVVSHGGSGTLLDGLAAGIPQVVLPQAADQFRNAAACAAANAGLALTGSHVTSETIEASIHQILNEDGFTTHARRLANEIASMPTIADAASAIEALVTTTG